MKVLFLNNLGVNMRQFLKFFRRDERGVTALEYAILAGIIVVAVIGVGTTFSTNSAGHFHRVDDESLHAGRGFLIWFATRFRRLIRRPVALYRMTHESMSFRT